MKHKWSRAGLVMTCWWTLATGLGTPGCASAPVIPLRGDVLDFGALADEWDGTYKSANGDREGSVWFKLIAGEDHAHGDVLMSPRGGMPYFAYGAGAYPRDHVRRELSRLLTIRFVRVSGAELDGTLDAYWDPTCSCQATTTFRGRLLENRLSGTFVTRHGGTRVATGRWEATRRRT